MKRPQTIFGLSASIFFRLLSAAIGLFLFSCQSELPEEVQLAGRELPPEIDFNLHVKPILSDKCFFCHGPDQANRKAGLRLDVKESAYAALEESGKIAVKPGSLRGSELVHRILATDADITMPPPESNVSLTGYEKAVLIRWIEEGAPYKKHWAYLPPEKRPLPRVKDEERVVNEIDRFLFSKLEKNGLAPQPEADKETLIRRATFDLTGLPPTPEEVDAFLADTDEKAYEKVVDRLLASPQYGEKMATDWMDVSRYADTHGYSVDRYRPMWPWRDWVIKAFNENMPFDRFVTWQLAGDLLPQPTKEQRLATAFNRNHSQNMEGGIVNEEFRVEYVADRTNTLGTALLSMTFECARCHDHKFDPISQKEYFQVFSFFNQVDEAGQISWDNATPVPTLLLTDEKQDSIVDFLHKAIAQQEERVTGLAAEATALPMSRQETVDRYLDRGLAATFDFEEIVADQFVNTRNRRQRAGIMEPQAGKRDILSPEVRPGKFGQALLLNGDDPLDLGDIGVFSRSEPFSVGVWLNIPESLRNGVIFHKGQGAIIYNFRGYHVALRDNRLEVLMAHLWPYNNIIKVSEAELPKDTWTQLTLTYDGSGRAAGLRLYLDGQELEMMTEKDNLYRTILFPTHGKQPGLRFGARWRGTGIKDALIDNIIVYERELAPVEVVRIAGKEPSLTDRDRKGLYLIHESPAYQREQEELYRLRTALNTLLDSVPQIMVMDELKEKRKTYLLERGAYDAPGEEVSPGTPASILPFPDSLPKNRLGLSQWLFLPENPLTARVIVNRYWQNYFGRGIVVSASDFGNQGDLPTHPELLDWLAIRFRESGWDVKALQKTIVLSAAYRQSSRTSKELKELDYNNDLISRGPSARLSAEMLRDNALAASGLLVRKIGGESVKPYQPEGLWRFNGGHYQADSGDKLYRRSLYTFWKRTVPPPTMNTFDAPDRSYCVVRRQKTSTPLQSLVLLNDPQFVEACRALAARVMQEKTEREDRLIHLYRLLTARRPSVDELALLAGFFEKQQADFAGAPEKMEGWLTEGEYEPPAELPRETLAAYSVAASMVLNSDAVVMKR